MKPSAAFVRGVTSGSGGESPKFHNPRTPRRALSVDPSPSMEYWPVSCWMWARTEAGGGPELTAGVVADLLYKDSERSVSGLMRRA